MEVILKLIMTLTMDEVVMLRVMMKKHFLTQKDALKSSGSIQKQMSVSEVNMELVGLNYPEVHQKKSLPQPKEKEDSVNL
jgi:hypothetical protein